MNPWAESCGVILLGAGGMLTGAWFSRLPRPTWLLGYFIPFAFVILYALGTRNPAFAVLPLVSWMMMGRTKFAVIGFIGAMVLATPLARLPQRRDRWAVRVLIVCVVFLTSVWPFLAPAFNRTRLAGLPTRIDADGICLQSTDYTCGPASAVTALRKLGIQAGEGELAILAHTSSATGTPPDILARVLQARYEKDGLFSEYEVFQDINDLKNAGPTLVVVKYNLMLDHYLTVLDLDDREITLGDPLNGLVKLSLGEFKKIWRYEGILLKRKMPRLQKLKRTGRGPSLV